MHPLEEKKGGEWEQRKKPIAAIFGGWETWCFLGVPVKHWMIFSVLLTISYSFHSLWVSILHYLSLSRAGQIVPPWLNLILSFIKLIQWKGFICPCMGSHGYIQDLTVLLWLLLLMCYWSGACTSAGGCRPHRHDELVLFCTELWVRPL